MDSFLIKQYHEILSLPNHNGNIVVFSDEEYGKYQNTIRYMVQNEYLHDLKIDNCNAFYKTPSFPYFEEHILEHVKESHNNAKQVVTNINIHGNVSNTNLANGNDIQQTGEKDSKDKSWIEKYMLPIIVALIGAVGAIVATLMQ